MCTPEEMGFIACDLPPRDGDLEPEWPGRSRNKLTINRNDIALNV